jgi:hypothetical protein
MIKSIIDFIEDEYKGIIITISFLMIILVVSFVMALISEEFCNIENNMNLNLEDNSACDKIETFDEIIETLIFVFLFIMTIGSIYGLYKLFEEVYDHFR